MEVGSSAALEDEIAGRVLRRACIRRRQAQTAHQLPECPNPGRYPGGDDRRARRADENVPAESIGSAGRGRLGVDRAVVARREIVDHEAVALGPEPVLAGVEAIRLDDE